MLYLKDIEFNEKEDSVEAFCVWEAGGSPWKYERKGHQILGRDLPHLWNISGSKHTLQWSTMITSYKSRGKPLKVREEGSMVWLLYIFCWKDFLHFKVNDLVSEGGSLLKFEGRISGDHTNWLLCNDFRKENFFCSIAKDFLFWGFREYRAKIIWEKHGMLPQSFSWQESTCMLYTFRRVHSSLFHVEIAKRKCKYQK